MSDSEKVIKLVKWATFCLIEDSQNDNDLHKGVLWATCMSDLNFWSINVL